MEPDKKQPMNISVSWVQPWHEKVWPTVNPIEQMDATQLEIFFDDIMTDDLSIKDCEQARNMLNNIGIKTQ